MTRLRDGIRRLNDSHGTINSATSGYHETITRAYVMLLAEFNSSCDATTSLAQRVARLYSSRLAAKDVLLAFYSYPTLMSEIARREWVEPDVAPIRLAGVEARADPANGRAHHD